MHVTTVNVMQHAIKARVFGCSNSAVKATSAAASPHFMQPLKIEMLQERSSKHSGGIEAIVCISSSGFAVDVDCSNAVPQKL